MLLGFTNEEKLRKWMPGGTPHATAAATAFLPATLKGPFTGLVLDPGSEASAFIHRRALELLAEGQLSTETNAVTPFVKASDSIQRPN